MVAVPVAVPVTVALRVGAGNGIRYRNDTIFAFRHAGLSQNAWVDEPRVAVAELRAKKSWHPGCKEGF